MPRRKGDDVEALILLNADERDPRYWAGVVGVNVRRFRRDLSLSQTGLSERLRLAGWAANQKMVSALESNSPGGGGAGSYVTMSVDRLVLLARVLRVQPWALMDDRWQRRVRDLLTPRSRGSERS